MVDPFIGKYSFVKVCSGVLKGDDVLYNADADAEEKPGKLYTMCGNKPTEVSELLQEISEQSQSLEVQRQEILFRQRIRRLHIPEQIIRFHIPI